MNTGFRLRPLLAALLVAAPLALPATASAQNWMARLRAIDVAPNVSSSVPGLSVNNVWTGELDFTYFFTKNVAVELILATTKHTVSINGASIGNTSVLPPTLTLQYHFTDLGAFKPYVGGGLNVTYFYNTDLSLGGKPLSINSTSTGGALQAGIDYEFAKNWVLNFDYKYIWISTPVNLGSTQVTNLQINPSVWGVGIGYRF